LPITRIHHHHHCNTWLYSISNSNNDNDGDDFSEGQQTGNTNNNNEEDDEDATTNNNNIFAALPPIGTSSFWDRQDDDDNNNNNTTTTLTSNNIVVSRKFQLSYTCKLCNTRNTHSITRLGYNHGVVIAVCKQCTNKHLIADNLGWSNYLVSGFDYEGGERNIEEYVRNRQEEEQEEESGAGGGSGLRVDKSVFDLESLWHEEKKDSDAAAMVVDNKDDEDWN